MYHHYEHIRAIGTLVVYLVVVVLSCNKKATERIYLAQGYNIGDIKCDIMTWF